MKDIKKAREITLYYSISVYVGMASAVIGPSLLILAEQTGSSLKEISNIFPARAGSYLVGSWLAGILFDRYRGHKLLTGGLAVMGITLGLVPGLADPIRLILLIVGMGLAIGLVDVGCNTLLFRVKSINIATVMNGLHFFYGLGSFFAPIILAGSLHFQAGIQWGYWGLALFSLLILGQIIHLPEPGHLIHSTLQVKKENAHTSPNRSLLILVIALFFFAFVGVEIGFGDWVYTYILQMGLGDERAAVLLTSVYWGAFTLGRLISIPLASYLIPRKLVLGNLLGAFIGLGLVLIFPENPTAVWSGTIILGLSLASMFPTMLTLAENLMPMTGKINSRFFISGSIGSMIVPWLIGRNVDVVGPIIIIRVLFLTLVIAGLMFAILSWISIETPAENSAGGIK